MKTFRFPYVACVRFDYRAVEHLEFKATNDAAAIAYAKGLNLKTLDKLASVRMWKNPVLHYVDMIPVQRDARVHVWQDRHEYHHKGPGHETDTIKVEAYSALTEASKFLAGFESDEVQGELVKGLLRKICKAITMIEPYI